MDYAGTTALITGASSGLGGVDRYQPERRNALNWCAIEAADASERHGPEPFRECTFTYDVPMPKVTEEQWKAQERRYLDAARRCVSRIGVAPASMEDIRSEAGVSAGAMYRYFPSKDALIHAAIETSLIEVAGLIGQVGESDDIAGPNAYLLALLETFRQFRHHTEGVDLFRLAVQGWAHAQTQPKTKAMVVSAFRRQRAAFAETVSRWTGRKDAPATAIAIGGAVIGYIVQSVFSDDDIDPKQYCRGVGSLT